MAEIAKWALLVAGILVVIILISALPIATVLTGSDISSIVSEFTTIMSPYIRTARGFINIFLSDFGRTLFSVVIGYLFVRFILLWPIKAISSVYHWIFKG